MNYPRITAKGSFPANTIAGIETPSTTTNSELPQTNIETAANSDRGVVVGTLQIECVTAPNRHIEDTPRTASTVQHASSHRQQMGYQAVRAEA